MNKRNLRLLLVFVLTMVLFATTALTVSATNVSNTVYASNLVENDEIVLTGDTTLFVNADLTLKSIRGDYALEIHSDGEHTLTIDNPNGSAIYVKTLKSVKPSQGTVNLTVEGGDGYFSIATTGDISLDGIKLDAKGGAGIRSAEGNVTINGSAAIVANYTIGIEALNGSISIDGNSFYVECKNEKPKAGSITAINAKGDVTIKSNDATITGLCGINSAEGNISLNGNIAIGAVYTPITAYNGSITMSGSVKASGTDTDINYFAIFAKNDITFTGTKLDVTGDNGIRSAAGNIKLNGNVSVVVNNLLGIDAYEGSISIDGDTVFVQSKALSGYGSMTAILAKGDVTIKSDDATITGLCGISSAEGNVSLTGNIAVGAVYQPISAHNGSITMNGSVKVSGTDTDENFFAIFAKNDITFTGTKLDVTGDDGIRSSAGDISLNGNISVVINNNVGIHAYEGSISIDGGSVYVQCKGSVPYGLLTAVNAKKDVTIKSDDATITGKSGIYSEEGNISLTGNITVGAVYIPIYAYNGSITMNGSVKVSGTDTDENFFAIFAKNDITFTGTKLDVTGDNGIRSSTGDIKLNGNISVVVNNNIGIHATEGSISIEGSSVSVECKGSVPYDLLTAVNANDGVTIKSTKATITGEYGIYSEEGSISLYSDVSIDANYYGIYAKTGNIYIKKNAVINGSNGAVSAENGVIFLDTFCNIAAPTNGSNIGSTIVDGNGVKATSVTIKYVPIATSDITITNNTQTKTSITAYKDLPIEFDFDVTFSDTLKANNPKYKVSITYRNINSVTTTVAHTWTSGTHFNKSITLGAAGVYKVAQIVEIDIDGDGQYDYSTNKVFTVNVASELPTYTITTNKAGMGGYINADVSYKVNGVATAQAKPGQTVTISAVPNANTSITYIKVMQGSNEVTVTDNSFVMPFGNVTVEVGLSHGTHYVTYRPGKGVTGDETVRYASASNNQITLLPTGYFSKAGYKQIGWTDTVNTYELGETITLAKNTVLYPVFEVVPFTITYKYGNNTFGGVTEYKGVNVGLAGATTLASEGFSKPGYRIIGWAKTENATTPDYACGDLYEEKVTVTLYPVFSQLTVIDVLDVIPKEKETVDVGDANMPFEAATDGLFTVVTKQNGTVIDQYYTIAQHSTTVLTVEFTAGAEYSFANDLSVYFDMYTPENIISVVWEKVSSDATTATFTVTIKSMCKTGHDFVVTKYAHPCVGETEDTVECTTCGFETTQARDANLDEHNQYNLILVEEVDADCVDKTGVERHYECEACGSWFTKPFGQPYTKIDPDSCIIEAGHIESGNYNGDGYHHWTVCVRCATQEPPIISIIPTSYAPCVDEDGNQYCDVCVSLIPCEHNWGEWTVYEYCDSEGQMIRECSICHDTENPAIQATGHTDSAWLSDGTNHYKECTVCHEITVGKTAHSGGTATCSERKECSVCSHKYGEFNTSNHTGTDEWTQTDTHHSKAYTCCGAVTVVSEAHEFTNGVCTECGYGCTHSGGTATCKEKAVCSICNHQYGEFDENNHTGIAKWTTTATTHEQKYDCCNAVVVASASHLWNNGKCIECEYECQHSASLVPGKAATCYVDGWKNYYECSHCGLCFADENCTTEIDVWSWQIGAGKIAAAHTYDNDSDMICNICDHDRTAPVTIYTVTFDSNGGSAVTAQTIEAGQKATKPADPTKDGFDFKGWTLNGSAYDFDTAVNGNITLVATWDQQQVAPTTYTVTFDSNGGSAVTAQTIEAGQKATKPADPTKDGFDFKGWTLNGSAYDFNTAVNGNITLVATWEQQQVVPTVYTVTFDSNGGSAVTAQNIEAGQKATKPADPTKDGYDFKGWTLNGSAYDFNTAVNGNITLVATWEQKQVAPTTYTVSFAANGGTGTMADVTGISGEYTLPANGFTAPDGKQFKAWSIGGNEKAVGDKITVTANTTVTAVWENIPVTTYTITFNANGGSVTPASAQTNAEGKLISLPTPTRSGSYSFKGWYTATSGGTKVTTSTVFNANTTIYAQWTYTGGGGGIYYPTFYTVTVNKAEGGSVIASSKSAIANSTITLTVTPDEGYEFEAVKVVNKSGKEITVSAAGDKFIFKMPSSNVTVTASFKKIEAPVAPVTPATCPKDNTCPMYGYTDLVRDNWYHDGVHFCIEEEMMLGTSATTFEPDTITSRAMVVTILWRLEGKPIQETSADFFDVPNGQWYTDAVHWASANGIVLGYGDSTFGPNDTITREQMATIMWRYAKYKGYEVSVGENTNILSYADVEQVSEWAIPAMQWACGSGLINGTGNDILDPNGNATRAQAATILYRFCDKIKEN